MKSIYGWLVIIVSITVFISSCKSSDDSSTTTTSSGLFIAVGGSGTLLTSPDGTTWTSQTTGTTNALRAVAYDDNSTLVAVGWSGTILTSSDGTTWTAQTSGTSNDINNVTYSGSAFVAVGDNGTLLSSTDGTTWTDRTSGCGMTGDMWDIAMTSGIGVVVGDNGSIYTSTDRGSTCTARSSGTTVELNELLYGDSTFVAAGDNGTVLTSSDGITWTSRSSSTTNDLYGGAYTDSNNDGNKVFALVGASGKLISSNSAYTTWTPIELSSLSTGSLYGVARGGTTWVIVGTSGYISSISDSDSDVTTRTSGTTEYLRRVFYKP